VTVAELPDSVLFPEMLQAVKDAGEDFEWYPTTDRMIQVVARHIPTQFSSLMDIGAGDGRVLIQLGKRCEGTPELYAIEKSLTLLQAAPDDVIPVGTDLFEQNLACLPVDYIFCNPPYSQFEEWATIIIELGHAKKAFLVIPRRWKDSTGIAAMLKRRGATASVIHSDDFTTADRRARALIDIVEISFPLIEGHRDDKVEDPFDIWFDENITTFDAEEEDDYDATWERDQKGLEKLRQHDTIAEMVEAYNVEHARMEENYKAIFRLDYALLKELGVNKNAVRDGIKKKMAGLKAKYWHVLFERLDMITSRLSTKTKERFLETLTRRVTLAFTMNNAYAVVIWAIKNANKYFGEQCIQLFRDLSTFEGALNYKSNQRTWERNDWRYYRWDEDGKRPSRYALDYRIVVSRHGGIYANSDGFGFGKYDYPGNLSKHCHEIIDDIRAVLYNLGFQAQGPNSRNLAWVSNSWESWYLSGTDDILFQAKAFKNGNIHFRFLPDAIKAINVEAGRLLGWLNSVKDVEAELGYTAVEAVRFFHSTRMLAPSNVKLLEGDFA
jgi:hypothetical protein